MRSILRVVALAAVFAGIVIAGGCSTISKSTAITYSYEPRVWMSYDFNPFNYNYGNGL